MDDHDFGGYATMANRKCTDGRTIAPEAFKHQDQQQVPLVWQHGHNSPTNILGHAVLEHRKDTGGTYAYAFFNETAAAIAAKQVVEHGDIKHLSIYANRLRENNSVVLHGNITEVSLVLSGANPGAVIDYVRLEHGDGSIETLAEEAIITSGEEIELIHATDTKTYQDVYDTLDADQKELVQFMVKQALENPVKHSDEDEGDKKPEEDPSTSTDKDIQHKDKEGAPVAWNLFDQDKQSAGGVLQHNGMAEGRTLTHAQIKTFIGTAEKLGSFKEALLVHAEDYGITNIEMLFPDAKSIEARPEWITRKMEWVENLLNGTRKVPWSRIKSMAADLTHEEARAKGYIKATMKKEQFFAITKRETTPATIYKKQKLDRDDIVDITDFDVVAWLWVEMYFMFREEAARAILVGDGREIDDPDKIIETKIRPIAHDDTFYTDVVTAPANTDSEGLIEFVLRNRSTYKGTNPTAYMTNAVMTDMLLAKDGLRRRYYNSKEELARALNVDRIVEVDVMEGQTRGGGEILMILVNIGDYSVGSTAGGEITKFDDFDIDFNQYKYLIESRFSGALTKHKSAQVIVRGAGTLATPTVPTFVPATGVITIPTVTGVTYRNQETNAVIAAGPMDAIDAGSSFAVKATANTGYYFPHNFDNDWVYTRPV